MSSVQLAAILMGGVLLASMVSVKVGISVALIELGLGIALGNAFNLDPNASWLVFIAGFASVVLTFLAGAEVDPDDFRERFWASIAIGVVSFAGPFVVATLIALGALGWTTQASLIAGTALSTTSLAVVYAVLVESWSQQGPRRQAHHERVLRDRYVHGDRALYDLHQADHLVSRLPRRLGGADLLAPQDRAVVLQPLRRPRDRARDQARLCDPALADGAGRRGKQSGGAARVRTRTRDVPPLPAPPGGAEAPARGRVRVPHAVLLHARRDERVAGGGVCQPRRPAVLLAPRWCRSSR